MSCPDSSCHRRWLAFLAAMAITVGHARAATDPLLGAWQLVALEFTTADGVIHEADCAGSLGFLPGGRMVVQVMYADATVANDYSREGYEASFGRYRLDSRNGRFTYTVEGALVRALIGQVQQRRFQISGDRLVVLPADATEHWRVTWQRAGAGNTGGASPQ